MSSLLNIYMVPSWHSWNFPQICYSGFIYPVEFMDFLILVNCRFVFSGNLLGFSFDYSTKILH